MCGLTGFISLNDINKYSAIENLKEMVSSISHRGPDENNIWTNNKVFLGHSRLSIIDLSETGRQPMVSKRGNVLVFNGEIINYQEVKSVVNHHFSKNNIVEKWVGRSDTEVLLKSIEYLGIEHTLKIIDGMFAFAYWNNDKKKLYLTRDRAGEKPLYYCFLKNYFVFGSELKSIKCFKSVDFKIDPSSRDLFFRYGYIPAPLTIYENIFKLNPGSYIEIDTDKNFFKYKKHYYWRSSQFNESCLFKNKSDSKGTKIINDLDKLITNSVQKNLIADVPVGCFLSGGIDSSLVTSIASKISEKKIDTFTIGFENKKMDESLYAKKISRFLRTNHNEIIVKEKDVIDTIPLIGEIYDEPFSDNSFVPSFILSKFARLKVKSCLSGDGGDELFGGYRRYFNFLKINKIVSNKVLRFFFKYLLIQDLDDLSLKHDSKIYFRFMQLLNYSKYSNTKTLYEKLISFKTIFKFHETKSNNLNEDKNKISETELKKFMMDFDFRNYLPDNNLTKMDRASMKNSLEVRSPLLSKEIIEFIIKIDPNLRINSDKKYLIKKVLEKYIPNSYFERPKRGFSIPLHSWLNDKLFNWATEILKKPNLILIGIINHEEILETWNDKRRRNFFIYEFWNLIVYILWYKNTFSKK